MPRAKKQTPSALSQAVGRALRRAAKVASVGLRVDLQGEDIAAPAVGECLLHLPAARGNIFDLFYQDNVVRPRDCPGHAFLHKCHRWWHL